MNSFKISTLMYERDRATQAREPDTEKPDTTDADSNTIQAQPNSRAYTDILVFKLLCDLENTCTSIAISFH